VPESYSLFPRLVLDRSWKPVYADSVVSFWLRNTSRWAYVPVLTADERLDAIPEKPSLTRVLALARFYGNIRRFSPAISLLNDALLKW